MTKKDITVKEDQLPSTEFFDDMVGDSGKGVSQAQEDNIVPLLTVLQALSPQVSKRDPSYVEGAEPGDMLKRNSVHGPLVKGTEGTIFQPCFFSKVWIEWKPNKGGMAGRHQERPSDAEEVEEMINGKPKKKWVRANGNYVEETREHVGFADNEPYVLPLKSSGHTVSRAWMQQMNQQIIPGTTKIAPSFAKKYRLTTVERSNNDGTWYIIKPEDAGWVTKEEYQRGKSLHEAFSRGEKQAASMEEEQSSPPF